MKTKPIILSLSLLLLSGTAVADDDCDDPVASWQPRENLREAGSRRLDSSPNKG